MSRTIDQIQATLRRSDSGRQSNFEDLKPISFDMYPVEILNAAHKELGEKMLPEYARELYVFGIKAWQNNAGVKAAQLNGILLTHEKLAKWLKTKSFGDIYDLNDKEILSIYMLHHIRQLEESLELFKIVASTLTR